MAAHLTAGGRIVTLTGSAGVGKSNLATAVAMELDDVGVTPIHFECRACKGMEGVRLLVLRTFSLWFAHNELHLLYNWLNSHQQRFLFIFDNVDVDAHLQAPLSAFMDDLLANVTDLRILCTCARPFFNGTSIHETHHVNTLRHCSPQLVDPALPDLHEKGRHLLAESVDHVFFGLTLCVKAFAIANVDTGRLFEDLTSSQAEGVHVMRMQDTIYAYTPNELEQSQMLRVALLVSRVIEHLPAESVDALRILTRIPADFDDVTAAALVPALDSESLQESLDLLMSLGMLTSDTREDGATRYTFPLLMRWVVDATWPDNGDGVFRVVKHYVTRLRDWAEAFGTRECATALAQMRRDYTNIVWTLRWLIEREDVHEYCTHLADLEYAMLLSDFLPLKLYEDLFESLGVQAEEVNDVITSINALCCLSYKSSREGEYDAALRHAEAASDVMEGAELGDIGKAFCCFCLGRAYFERVDKRSRAVALVRRSLDAYKQHLSLRHIKSLFVNEEYGRFLAATDHVQLARAVFNLSDLVMHDVIDAHPLLVRSFEVRRAIWDSQLLFARAGDAAQKAAEIAQRFYGEHPLTARMITRVCECLIKRGSLQDCVDVCVRALRMRIKVLGDHLDTGLSYKSLAYLLLRSGQYDDAMRFAQSALDVYDKIDAGERYRVDARNVMTQARTRLEARSSIFGGESKSGSKTDLHNQSCFASFSTEV